MSDSDGCIYDKNGIDISCIKKIKEVERGRIKKYLDTHPEAEYFASSAHNTPIWNIKADIVLPCATQNEIDLAAAKKLVANGVVAIGEGANMPCTYEATEYFLTHGVLVAPAKAANAGGVATSAIEMSQNSMRFYYTFDEVDEKLSQIMINIFRECKLAAENYGLQGNYVAGANIAAFKKLAEAMKMQGVV